jgi:hypothetical protein
MKQNKSESKYLFARNTYYNHSLISLVCGALKLFRCNRESPGWEHAFLVWLNQEEHVHVLDEIFVF